MKKYGYEKFDQISYEIGISGCFIEMVAAGVKKLALSTPLTKENKTILLPAIQQIAQGYNVKIYTEQNLLDTNLSPEGYIKNKTILIYYKDDQTLNQYLNLKEKEKKAQEKGAFTQDYKNQQTIEFCKLLSYPDQIINQKYAKPNQNQDKML